MPCYRTPDNTLTSKEVFNWAKRTNRRLLHVGDIDKTSKNGVVQWGAFMKMWEAKSKRKTPQK
uniref:Uncharacterized protein n=1 Tax=Oryza glumipatula TaxID=40148 RepID=A0A0D9ZBK0_9ORYZ